ncbi:MAG: hypothetical protein IKL22_01800 [Lachnospiraceae bacterium]|nr:hypothetical protein [Lachnospiraceae bacterium]
MKIPFLATLFLFLLVLGRALKKNTKTMNEQEQSFWQRERAANSVRKKPMDDLEYIFLPLEQLPAEVHRDDTVVQECLDTLTILKDSKIVNLTGITNTDLKLAYGTANITVLTEYDQNYTSLITTLQKWADRLYELGDMDNAKTILEYAVSVHSDITATYLLLAEIYSQSGLSERIPELISAAEKLTGTSGKIILRKLQETYPSL